MGKANNRLVSDGILKVMSVFKLLNCYVARLLRVRKQLNNLTIKQLNNGFSLIELLVVITLFALTSSLITAAYVSFERGQRVKNTAQALKSDIRFAQNKALAGEKGAAGACSSTSTLGGWYVELTNNSKSYRLAGDCLGLGFGESDFNSKTVNLPTGVTITRVNYVTDQSEVNILFRPLSYNVSVFGIMFLSDFYNNSGNLRTPLGSDNDLIIELSITGSSQKYQVVVKPSGEVNEVKI